MRCNYYDTLTKGRWLRHSALFAAFLAASFCLINPAAAYLDAEAAYRMALRHHHPLGAKRKNYRHAMILYCRADSDEFPPDRENSRRSDWRATTD